MGVITDVLMTELSSEMAEGMMENLYLLVLASGCLRWVCCVCLVLIITMSTVPFCVELCFFYHNVNYNMGKNKFF